MDHKEKVEMLWFLLMTCIAVGLMIVIQGCGGHLPPPPQITTTPVWFKWNPPAYPPCGKPQCLSSYVLMDWTTQTIVATPASIISSITIPIQNAALNDEFALVYHRLETDGTITTAPQALTVIVRK